MKREHKQDRFDHKGGQSRDTHVVISQDLFTLCAWFKVCLTIIFLFFGGFQKWHLVQSTRTRKFFMTVYF